MMISPGFFYTLHAMSAVSDMLSIIGMIATVAGGIATAMTMEDNDIKSARAWKNVLFAGALALLAGALIPNRETMLLMEAAKLAAPQSADMVFEELCAVMDYAAAILK